jgi:hypothetical protein
MTDRPTLQGAIRNQLAERQTAADEAARPERAAREQRLAADARLHGTAGWSGLSPARREMVSAWVARQAQEGGNDA